MSQSSNWMHSLCHIDLYNKRTRINKLCLFLAHFILLNQLCTLCGLSTSAGFKEKALSAGYGGGPFSGIFPGMKCLFACKNFHFGPKQISVVSKSEKKGEKKKVVCHPACLLVIVTGAL